MKPKALNTVAEMDYGYLCLRVENRSRNGLWLPLSEGRESYT